MLTSLDPWYAEPPAWLAAVIDEFSRLGSLGDRAEAPAYRSLFRFLSLLEIDDFPRPRCEVVSATCLRLTWADGRKTMRLIVGPHSLDLATSERQPAGHGHGRRVNMARITFDWFREKPTPPTWRSKP